MAVVMTEERQAASLALMRHMGEVRSSRQRRNNAKLLGRPVILVLEHDSVGDVLKRVQAYGPPVLLAIYYVKSGEIRLMGASPEAPPEGDSTIVTEHHDATIGEMLGPQKNVSMSVTAWQTIGLKELVDA